MYDLHSPKSSNTQNGGSHKCRLHVTLRNPHPTQNKKLYKVQYLHLIRITATIMDNLAWSLSLQNEKMTLWHARGLLDLHTVCNFQRTTLKKLLENQNVLDAGLEGVLGLSENR